MCVCVWFFFSETHLFLDKFFRKTVEVNTGQTNIILIFFLVFLFCFPHRCCYSQRLKTAITSGYLITELARKGLPRSLIIQGNGSEVFANLSTELDTDIIIVRIATDILWDRYRGQLQLNEFHLDRQFLFISSNGYK